MPFTIGLITEQREVLTRETQPQGLKAAPPDHSGLDLRSGSTSLALCGIDHAFASGTPARSARASFVSKPPGRQVRTRGSGHVGRPGGNPGGRPRSRGPRARSFGRAAHAGHLLSRPGPGSGAYSFRAGKPARLVHL